MLGDTLFLNGNVENGGDAPGAANARIPRQQTEASRRGTVIFALVLCLIVFLSEEASYKESREQQRRLRGSHAVVPSVAVPSEVAMQVFKSRLNGTFSEEVSITNVYLGKLSVPGDELSTQESAFDVEEMALRDKAVEINDQEQLVRVFSVLSVPKRITKEETPPDKSLETEAKKDETDLTVTDKKEASPTSPRERELRWNLDKSVPTSLEGANRISGVLWVDKTPVQLSGIHLTKQGRMTLFSTPPTDKTERILGLMTPIPENLAILTNVSAEASRNGTMLRGSFGGLNGLAFGEPAPRTTSASPSSESDESTPDSELFPGCSHPVRFDLHIKTPPEGSKSEGESSSSAAPAFWGLGTCKNASVTFRVPLTTSLSLDVDRAVKAASFLSLFAIMETFRTFHILTFLGPLRNGVLADMGPLSLASFGWMALMDMYMSELMLNASGNIGGDGWWITAAIAKGCIFLFSHIPLLVLIFFGRSRMNGESNDAVLRNLSSCMSRAQFAWLVSMVLFEFVRQRYPRVFAVMWVSYWFPQMYCTATLNVQLPIGFKDIVSISVLRGLWPVILLSTNILDTLAAVDRFGVHTDATVYDPLGAVLVIAVIAFQLGFMHLQKTFGPQFFVPRMFRPKTFDYYAGKEGFAGGEECVVCMQTIQADDLVTTPCHHNFHEQCLGPWLQMKRTCPTCRASLPPLNTVDSHMA